MKNFYNKSNDPATEKKLDRLLSSLYGFYPKDIELGLSRLYDLLEKLGNPHQQLPPVIHVAGTNGKGSTLAALRTLLEHDGKQVHTYTSPHLVHPTERIALAGRPISSENLITVLEECITANNNAPITFFEIFTAATFLAMSHTPADYALIETGMGGRLDSTNVIDNPACTIITTISKDHQEFLGDSIEKIAAEKAGIMKAGVPCVIGQQTYPQTYDVFRKKSQDLSPDAPLMQYGSEWRIEMKKDRFIMAINDQKFECMNPNLIGLHQIYNVGAAIAAYRVIKKDAFDAKILSPDNPKNPLWKIFWPGRLQKIDSGPLAKILKENQELWIDGGHNDSAGEALATQAKIWQEHDGKPLTLIIAMVNRKDPQEFITPLLPYADKIIASEIPNEQESYSSAELYKKLKSLPHSNIESIKDVQMAITDIDDPNARILICGSLYLMGALLK